MSANAPVRRPGGFTVLAAALVTLVTYVQKQAEALFGTAVPRPSPGTPVRRRTAIVPPRHP